MIWYLLGAMMTFVYLKQYYERLSYGGFGVSPWILAIFSMFWPIIWVGIIVDYFNKR
jgi:hypothetical protein